MHCIRRATYNNISHVHRFYCVKLISVDLYFLKRKSNQTLPRCISILCNTEWSGTHTLSRSVAQRYMCIIVHWYFHMLCMCCGECCRLPYVYYTSIGTQAHTTIYYIYAIVWWREAISCHWWHEYNFANSFRIWMGLRKCVRHSVIYAMITHSIFVGILLRWNSISRNTLMTMLY